MNPTLAFVIYLLALLCFLGAAAGVDGRVRVSLVPLGLALLTLAFLIQVGEAAF